MKTVISYPINDYYFFKRMGNVYSSVAIILSNLISRCISISGLGYYTSLMLHILREQSSLPLANFVGSTREKSTDQALFWCSLYWANPCPVLASHI